jgi:pimeloyl-ACP methyl ester carboxylesterase
MKTVFSRRRAMLAAVPLAAAAVAFGSTVGSGAARPVSAAKASAPLRCSAPGHKAITVVLVHGAFADDSSWDGEVARLQAAGCTVYALANPLQGLASDSQTVADFVRSIHGPVLLVGHSYGGSVITNAAAEVHNVVGLVYVDAVLPAVGEKTINLLGAGSAFNHEPASKLFTDVPFPGAPKGVADVYLKQGPFLKVFASDIPRAQALRLWSEQRPASVAALGQPTEHAAWKTIPSWSFISTGDKIITPASMLQMAHRANSHITMFHGGSHLTLISHPAAVTATIGSALNTLLGKR